MTTTQLQFNLDGMPKNIQKSLKRTSPVYGSTRGKTLSYTKHFVWDKYSDEQVQLHVWLAGFDIGHRKSAFINLCYKIYEVKTKKLHFFCGSEWESVLEKLSQLRGQL